MAFFSFRERDHDLAVIKVPDDQPVGNSGTSHAALQIDGGPEQLQEFCERLKALGVEPESTVDHVFAKSIYLLDPDGNRLELFSQVMPSSESKSYLPDARSRGDLNRPL